MENFYLALAVISAILYGVLAPGVFFGMRSIRTLRAAAVDLPASPPRVSIIVAARNEARHLREALSSLLAQDYPALELVAVDDRSTDATGAILEELAGEDPRLVVVRVRDLPPKWLGKNHALNLGAAQAGGEYLLFTDADIVMDSSTVRRAVAYALARQLDHLAMAPEMRMPTPMLRAFGLVFGLFFALFTRPWRVPDPGSAAHIGIGAFNLVRARAYRAAGTHRTIALRPDDDLKLGKILKKSGARQELVFGTGLVRVEWYASVGELIRGLEKNAFAGADYRVGLVLWGTAVQLLTGVWPFAAVFFTDGAARLLSFAVAATLLALCAVGAPRQGISPRYALGFPLAALLFAFILLRTMILNLVQGGIYWRGTFYPLKELRANKV